MDNEKDKNLVKNEILFSILKLVGIIVSYYLVLGYVDYDRRAALAIMFILVGLIKSPSLFNWWVYTLDFNGASFVCILIELFLVIISGVVMLPYMILKNMYVILRNVVILYEGDEK